MLSNHERRRIVYDHLKLVSMEYRECMDRLVSSETSRGLVAQWGGSGGGRSGKITDLTAASAVLDACDSIATQKARAWRGMVSRVYAQLIDRGRKTPFTWEHDQLLAWLLFERVLLGKKLIEIADQEVYGSGRVNISSLSRYFSEVLDLCVAQAIKSGLIP